MKKLFIIVVLLLGLAFMVSMLAQDSIELQNPASSLQVTKVIINHEKWGNTSGTYRADKVLIYPDGKVEYFLDGKKVGSFGSANYNIIIVE